MRTATTILCLLLAVGIGLAQTVMDTSYEKGATAPEGWTLSGGPGKWEEQGYSGKRSVSLTGDGKNSSGWSTPPLPLEPSRAYRYSVWYKSVETGDNANGVMTLGPTFVMRINRHSPEWTYVEYVFCAPTVVTNACIRNGQWHFNGTVWYDDCRVEPVNLVFLDHDGISLDQHERIEKGTYVFEPNFGTPYTNCMRVDQAHTVSFHHDRWWFHDGEWMVHRYHVGRFKQTSADLVFSIVYTDPARTDNEAKVEVSPDSKTWQEIGKYNAVGECKMTLPASLFPAEDVFVRMTAKGSLQVKAYKYSAKLDGAPPDVKGTTDAFQGSCVVADSGALRLTFEEGGRRLVSISRGKMARGSLECGVAQFEKKGVGYKRTGVGVAKMDRVKTVEVKVNEPKRCVLRVTAERTESSESARRFQAVYEFTLYAGQDWFEAKLLSVANTDEAPYELRGYVDLLEPGGGKELKPWCFPSEAGWVAGGPILGAAAASEGDFTFALRMVGENLHGDITRAIQAKLPPGQTWSGSEPGLIVFATEGGDPQVLVQRARAVRKIIQSPEAHATGAIVLEERKPNAVQPNK